MFCHLVTNGHRFTDAQAQAYRNAGLVGLSISMEHHDPDVLAKNRGRAGVKDDILRSLAAAKAAGHSVFAYILISRLNLGQLEEICLHHMQAGFSGINFCYPISNMGSTFEVGGERMGDVNSVNLEPQEMIAALETVRRLRNSGNVFVYNPEESIDLAISWLEKRAVKYPCLGGSRVFWLDWNLDLFICATRSEMLGNILELDELPQSPSCNQCLFQGFRDLSIYLQGWPSVGPLARLGLDHLRQGKFAL
jgi:MoaA/NifB/PqqE/SkfB family radical SAM enzyme